MSKQRNNLSDRPIAIVTGSAGLIGSETVRELDKQCFSVIGIDNDMRSYFFGAHASTQHNSQQLEQQLDGYISHAIDIRDAHAIERLFKQYGEQTSLIVHTAAQPSHDWAAREPFTDFAVNATGTLNLLESTRRYCPDAVFIFTSTNKVYGDKPNQLPLEEHEHRWEIDPSHPYTAGIDENMSIDQTTRSLFGASKTAADIMVQEYGRYFGMKTGVFRGGCLTGPNHAGTELHGFLAHLMKCIATQQPYRVFGYKGKQVRDNIHSSDLVSAFLQFYENPRPGEVYNIGGGRHSNCSILEAIKMGEDITGNKLDYEYVPESRKGDHIWYISDTRKFQNHYPAWKAQFDQKMIIQDICSSLAHKEDRI